MSYHQFTSDERKCLWELHRKNLSIRKIADALGRAPSSVSRELRRNRSEKGTWHPFPAHKKAKARRRHLRNSSLQTDLELRAYVIDGLNHFWTPEEIAGRWSLAHPDRPVSFATIYRHIKRKLLPGIEPKTHLRRRGKRKVNRNANFNTIHPDRIIPDWPDEIKNRLRIGDWEGDSIVGAKGKGAAVPLVVCSLSLDNGSEFAEFRQLEEALEAPIFFAEPHKPWQRGCNENGNGLLRFFFPKGCDFLAVSPEYFAAVIDLLNHRPRKRLGWRTPFEVFFGVALA